MADVLHPSGIFITWKEARHRGAGAGCETAFRNLLSNLNDIPDLRQPEERMTFFLEEHPEDGSLRIWQFCLLAARLTEAWIPFMDNNITERTFLREGTHLRPTRLSCPSLGTIVT